MSTLTSILEQLSEGDHIGSASARPRLTKIKRPHAALRSGRWSSATDPSPLSERYRLALSVSAANDLFGWRGGRRYL